MWIAPPGSVEKQINLRDVVSRWEMRSVATLTGDNRAFALAHSWMLRHHMMGKEIRIIDCAVRFDSMYLVDEVLRHDLDIDTVINGMHIARAFTPYQILSAVDEISTKGSMPNVVYYILAPFKQFFDGDVRDDEAAHLLYELNKRLQTLGQSGRAILVVEKSRYKHPAFVAAYFKLRQMAEPAWEILDIEQPHGIVSVLRTGVKGVTNGKNHRTIQHPNASRRAATREVSERLAALGSGAVR